MAVVAAGITLILVMRIGMANDTIKHRKIARCGMTIHTLIPFIFMLAAIDWKILLIMVKTGRLPSRLRMTFFTGSRIPR